MRLSSLHLLHFRSYERLSLAFEGNRHLIYGENGQGKTNLLEAIYFASTFKSFRVHDLSNLIYSQKSFFNLGIEYEHDDLFHELEVQFQGGKKNIKLDNKPLTQQRKHFRQFPALFFSHYDLEIAGSAIRRRDLFDHTLSLLKDHYADSLRSYQKALRERNAELKLGRRNEIWEETLAAYGTILINARLRFIKAIGQHFQKMFRRFFASENIEGRLGYLSAGLALSVDMAFDEEDYLRQLRERLPRDLRTGTTSFGPHRDDFDFFLGNMPLQEHASQGQTRLFIYALKWTLYDYLQKTLGVPPILLIDDIFSDLDLVRTEAMFQLLAEASQVFLATPRCDTISEFLTGYQRHEVQHGQIQSKHPTL